MAKKSFIHKALSLIAWLTGILVSLAVGFGMISGTLTVPFIQVIVPAAGWIVVIGTILSLIMAILDK